MSAASRPVCPLCEAPGGEFFFERHDVPAQDGVLWQNREAAMAAPRVDTRLAFCRQCGGIWNDSYDPGAVGFARYDVSTESSDVFRSFLEDLVRRLAEAQPRPPGHILDIACGRGVFLEMLVGELGGEGVGIDPNAPMASRGPIRFIRDYFGPGHAAEVRGLVTCRHLLDILPDPIGFLRMLRACVDDRVGASLYLEVASAGPTFRGGVVWNIIHERRTWFTPESLRRSLTRAGFAVQGVGSVWNDEYLGASCVPGSSTMADVPSETELNATRRTLLSFVEQARAVTSRLEAILGAAARDGAQVALWGAGARGVMVMTNPLAGRAIGMVVDINPARQGLFLPHSGAKVEAPEMLRGRPPDLLLISNPAFSPEIREQAKRLGLSPRFVDV